MNTVLRIGNQQYIKDQTIQILYYKLNNFIIETIVITFV